MQYLPQVASPVLDVWAKNVADPLISEDALSVLGVIAQQPACLQPLAQQEKSSQEALHSGLVLSAVAACYDA
eukprot:1161533-Pelagomonas_calceolata.AAC.2